MSLRWDLQYGVLAEAERGLHNDQHLYIKDLEQAKGSLTWSGTLGQTFLQINHY